MIMMERVLQNLFACVVGGLLVSACLHIDGYHSRDDYEPIYMSYEDLRASIKVTEPEPLREIGRLYLYDDHIFLIDSGRGIHVIDNRDATAPKNIAFVVVPGSNEISIRDGFLYVDSFVDLVTLDARNPAAIVEVDRRNGIFPYDPYQVIEGDINFYDYDTSQGVVVGYRKRG